MAPSPDSERIQRTAGSVVRHGRRMLLAGGFMLAAWFAGAAAAHADAGEALTTAAELTGAVDEVVASQPVEDAADTAARAAAEPDAALDAASAALPVEEGEPLSPVSETVDAVVDKAPSAENREARPDSSGRTQAARTQAALPSAEAHSAAPDSAGAAAVLGERAAAATGPAAAAHSAAEDNSGHPAEPARADTGEVAAAAASNSASAGSPVFGSLTPVPGIPADAGTVLMRTRDGGAAASAAAHEPSTSPD